MNTRSAFLGVAFFVFGVLGLCGGNPDRKDEAPSAQPTVVATAPGDACTSSVRAEPGLVVTAQGGVRGSRDAGTYAYKGIAFAAPPVGALRFRAPEAPPCFTGVTQAADYGSACLQLSDNGSTIGDEDCLYLNVWAPVSSAAPRPVMFFIHGGGHIQGSASQRTAGQYLYDGAKMSERGDVVVVTTNYRLGALGFLALETLSAENKGASGNYGLLDNVAALAWVQKNIAAFGGDPARVMIFGESAGAVQVCALVASPLAKGLFSSAIMESGGCSAAPLALRQRDGDELVKAAQCETAASVPDCLRKLPAADVIKARPGSVDVAGGGLSSYGPAIDGYALKTEPWRAIAAGEHNKVPMIVGANSDETSRSVRPVATCAAYEVAMRTRFALAIDAVLRLYPCNAYPTPTKALVAATTDVRFICTARRDLKALVKGQSQPAYRYFFTHAAGPGPGRVARTGHTLCLSTARHRGLPAYRSRARAERRYAQVLDAFRRHGRPKRRWPRRMAALRRCKRSGPCARHASTHNGRHPDAAVRFLGDGNRADSLSCLPDGGGTWRIALTQRGSVRVLKASFKLNA